MNVNEKTTEQVHKENLDAQTDLRRAKGSAITAATVFFFILGLAVSAPLVMAVWKWALAL